MALMPSAQCGNCNRPMGVYRTIDSSDRRTVKVWRCSFCNVTQFEAVADEGPSGKED
jgi:hypothetical protein